MNQLIQSYKTGELGIFDVPSPVCDKNGVLIRTAASLVSAGTEKMIVDIAKKSLLGKAQARPDLVKQVIQKRKQEGVRNKLEKVFNKLDTPITLGYSCAGRVVEIGEAMTGVSVGDRVACGGAGFASHAEVNYIPKNLFVKIPDSVDDIDASFVTVGSIALQGVRQADPKIGENIVVIGLGLLGQLTVQLLKANGCRVLGTDLDPDKLKLALSLGADMVCDTGELIGACQQFTTGYGADAVIITASTSSNQPVVDAGEVCRMKGRVIMVGVTGMEIPRSIYYKKELEFKLSMAYGPGRYDPDYEEKGIDYPYPFVRWTEQRNFQAFLNLVAGCRVTPKKLITHTFDFSDALKAYDLLEGKVKEKYLAIVLKYQQSASVTKRETIRISDKTISADKISVGLIGAGNFTKSVILPQLVKNRDFALCGLCTATGISAHSTGKKYGFKHITTDAAAIFNNPEINTVFITTRHNTHAAFVLEALKHQKHVFVEKPLCLTEEELFEIKKCYAEMPKKVVLQVGFNRRHAPLILKMKEISNNQKMSMVYRINAGVIPRNTWIQDPAVGGGRIVGEVCHFIDTCLFLVGSQTASVFASCVRQEDKSMPDEDNVNIVLNFVNGCTASINYFAYGNRQMPKEYIEVFCSDKAMQLCDFRELAIFSGSKTLKYKNSGQDKGFANEFTTLANAVKGTGNVGTSVNEAFLVTETALAVLQSLNTGLPVKIGA
ncbi:MAG: bi-domain-containing oxidoreductase [Candidatus Wallbacteria bacterium]|nr:bi-domain-containing oxidoreductase [Candidatus Wallbacteria bacterium]